MFVIKLESWFKFDHLNYCEFLIWSPSVKHIEFWWMMENYLSAQKKTKFEVNINIESQYKSRCICVVSMNSII